MIEKNKWFHMVSSNQGEAVIKVNQNVNVSTLELDEKNKTYYRVKEGRQAYLVQIEGKSNINGTVVNERDAMEIVEENINIKAEVLSHFIVVEMRKA